MNSLFFCWIFLLKDDMGSPKLLKNPYGVIYVNLHRDYLHGVSDITITEISMFSIVNGANDASEIIVHRISRRIQSHMQNDFNPLVSDLGGFGFGKKSRATLPLIRFVLVHSVFHVMNFFGYIEASFCLFLLIIKLALCSPLPTCK
jgi:hypothetical protein